MLNGQPDRILTNEMKAELIISLITGQELMEWDEKNFIQEKEVLRILNTIYESDLYAKSI